MSREALHQTSILRRLCISLTSGRAALQSKDISEQFVNDGTGTHEECGSALLALWGAKRIDMFDGWIALVIPEPEPGRLTSVVPMPDGTEFMIMWQPE